MISGSVSGGALSFGLAVRLQMLVAVLCLAVQAQPADDRHVILVSIDGFASYALEDPKLAIPNLRSLIRSGAVARRLEVVNPSVTWPNHTSMVTGVTPSRHGVLYNGLPVRGEGPSIRIEPWRDKSELVRVPTIYDLAQKAGMTTAEVDWVAIFRARTITWPFSEVPDPSGAVERELVAASILSQEDIATFSKHPITWRDEIWTKAAAHIFERHKPNLLMFHLLATDSVQHTYAPKNLATAAALALADARLGELLAAVARSGVRDRTTLIVVSDHGFKTVRKQIRPNSVLRQKGLSDRAIVMSEGGSAIVYIQGDAAPVRAALQGIEGVDRIIDPAEYARWGFPTPQHDDRMGELVLAARDGYSFFGASDGEAVVTLPNPTGAHGYLSDDPEIYGIFVASGAGIRAGARIDTARTIDIAPTIARLLGLKMGNIEGRALDAIFTAPAP
ncbi:MAG TPA: ectonucleotide pyrophosphatase/phosphodiesterase [Bryobacteraceae bacterium]|nr:ectonucleotide pyrophosphatase/phosphodiesterase [Bryobacteraceae bacterium]